LSPPDVLLRAQPLPPDLAAALASAAGRIGSFGRHVHWYAEAPSTNDLAAMLAERGVDEGTAVIADAQTAGRGRQGRAWSSPAGAGLYVSIVLRPHQHVVPLLTMAAGVALVEGIRGATGLTPDLKWPNDVYVCGRKLAGILVEAALHGGASQQSVPAIHGCVLGFGINVRAAAYPPGIALRATSLERELGREVDRGILLAECLASLAARYDDLRENRSDVVLEAWRTFARPLLGRAVEWDSRDGVQRGTAEGVDGSGALLVRTAHGVERLIAGEVRWI
jgi:BirA family transcriptional regulator, biotin operon repressor / biotin---[acetyl-CoA-carboxylase] ligase